MSRFLPWTGSKEATDTVEATVLHRGWSSATRQVSAQNLGEGMSEQLLSTGPVFGIHKNAAHEVPCLVGGVWGQQWVGGLSGDLEYGCHGLIFSPWRLFCEHLHHRATKAPVKEMQSHITSWNLPHIMSQLLNTNILKECFECKPLHSLAA